MSKKHFEWAAARVRGMRAVPFCEDVATHAEDAYCALFAEFGPRFDVERFRAACRVPA